MRALKKVLSLALLAVLLLSCVSVLAESSYTAPAYSWKFIKKIPMKPKYTEEVDHKGTVEKLTYMTHSYALEAVAAGDVQKAADDNDTTPAIDKEKLCGEQTEEGLHYHSYLDLGWGHRDYCAYCGYVYGEEEHDWSGGSFIEFCRCGAWRYAPP